MVVPQLQLFLSVCRLLQMYYFVKIYSVGLLSMPWEGRASWILPSLVTYKVKRNITKTHLFKYIENFTTKTESFQIKILIFFIFLLKTETVLTSPHNLYFWTEVSKIMYNPVNTSFTV